MWKFFLPSGDTVIRSSALGLLFMGMGASMAFPLLTLYLVEDLGYRPSVASLFFLTSLVGPLVSVATGRLSDRVPSRYPLIGFTALWLALGWLLIAFARSFWLVALVGVLFFGFIGTLNAQIFAQLRDYLTEQSFSRQNQIVASVRTAYAAGWIIGPILGSWVGLAIGLRELFVLTALLYLVSLAPLWYARTSRRLDEERQGAPTGGLASAWRVFVFAGLCALAMSGDTLKLSLLPLFMREQLAAPAWLQGAVISTQPVLELLLIPAMGVLADRIGAARLLIIGACAGIIGNALFALGQSIFVLFLGQAFVSVLVASVFGLGVTVAQDLYPEGVGYASSIFFSSLGLSAALGGALGSIGVAELGMPGVFIIPALVNAVVGLGFYLLRLTRSAQSPAPERYRDTADGV
jgi:SET family sugar efflux transporter-like MFS transporter